MTKLDKLLKEYHKTHLDLYTEDGSPEMEESLFNKLRKLENEIMKEKIRIAKRGRRR